jgi:acetyl-CoA C-acetyltransferase/acetyl-CoA acyltransferase
MFDGMEVVLAGGQDNISAVQNRYFEWVAAEQDRNVLAHSPHAYMPMLHTAEFVSRKYGISREAQDQYAHESHQRTARAQAEGRLNAEIVPISTQMLVTDKVTGQTARKNRHTRAR